MKTRSNLSRFGRWMASFDGRGTSALHRPPASSLFFFLTLLLTATALPAAWVYESTNEFFSAADLDGDGRADLVVVDKASGDYRLGYQLAPGAFAWAGPRASGIENVTGFSIGRMTNSGGQDLLFTSLAANRINLLRANQTNVAGLPHSVYLPSIGPSLVVTLDIGGAGNNPALDDVLAATDWNASPQFQLHTLRNGPAGFSPLVDDFTSFRLSLGNRVRLKSTQPWMAAAIGRSGLNVLWLIDVSTGDPNITHTATGLGSNVRGFVAGFFNNSSLLKFLIVRGDAPTSLILRPILESTPGTFSFGGSVTFTFTNRVEQVIASAEAPEDKLLIIHDGGQRAGFYQFDGTNMPVLIHLVTAGPGETFTGAGPQSAGNFVLFSGRDGATTTTFFQAWNWNGSTYTAGASGELPLLTRLSAPGNVFFFSGEPFVTNAPILLRTVNARDWSIQLDGLPGAATAQSESFANPSNGLRNPLPVVLGPPPSGTTHSLYNQYRNPISLFGHGPASGDTVADVSFTPEPGAFASGVSVTLRPNAANAQAHYRLDNAGAWTPYTTPLRLFKTTTIQAYATAPSGGAKSRIKTANYTITTPPDELDSDGDGVPDYVEVAKGTDPTRPDSDNDGYTDWDELLTGTNNTNATQKRTTFDLRVTPRPLNGLNGTTLFAAPGSSVRAHTLPGGILGAGEVVGTFATLTNVSASQTHRLLTFSTDPNFDARPLGQPALDVGRELLGMMPMPAFTNVPVPNTYTGGDLLADANAWVAAASNAWQTVAARPEFTRSLTLPDTLAAALFEQAVARLLLARGESGATNLTLFPARLDDAARYAPPVSALGALESYSNGLSAYSLRAVFLSISNQVDATANPDILSLRRITTNIYRISSASNYVISTNIVPSGTLVTNPVYPLPLDVLRQFFDTGTIHSNYYAGRLLAPEEFSSTDLANAWRAVTNILASLAPRPVTNVVLQVRPDTFSGACTLLDAPQGAATWALVDSTGAPYRLLEAFDLVPGSQLGLLGFTDAPTNPCVPVSLEVISVDLLSVPAFLGADLNGNGLPDNWESLFQITDPEGDADGDAANNRAEFLAGTDPRDPSSRPPAGLVHPLAPPLVHLERLANGSLRLSWSVPAEWRSRVEFQVLATSDLRQPFADTALLPAATLEGWWVVVPAELAARFFMVTMTTR
jgi:hypothetical protein